MNKGLLKSIFAVLFLLPACADAAVNSNSIIEDGIEYYVQTDKSVYDLGEDVEMLYKVTNLRSEEWRFNYIPPIMDITVAVKEEEFFNEIWHWSWDKIYPAGPVVFQLGAGESAELNGIWPQIDLNGSVEIEDHTQVPPGIYRTIGVFYPTDSHIAVGITIVPEPATLFLLALGAAFLKKPKKQEDSFFCSTKSPNFS
jgi:hypothetical protein